jgi:hypothetical protein
MPPDGGKIEGSRPRLFRSREISPQRKIAAGIRIGTGIAICRRVETRMIGEGVGRERNGVIPGRREGVIDGLIAARIVRV